jgi:hypothetical protein
MSTLLMYGVGRLIYSHCPDPQIAPYGIKSKKLMRSPQWILEFVAGRQ